MGRAGAAVSDDQGVRSAITRVAVLPFEPAQAGVESAGWAVAEGLEARLVRLGRVRLVERGRLKPDLDWSRITRARAPAPRVVRRLGAQCLAGGIVTGRSPVRSSAK